MKKRMKWTCLLFVALSFLFIMTKEKPVEMAFASLLDVPLENQNEGDPLGNGCEITALSMLLNYYGYETNKNQLAEKLDYVPLYIDADEEIYGDPREGFVGDITGGFDAMGVAVEPIAKVAQGIVHEDYQVHSEAQSFQSIVEIVEAGIPVWVIVTVDFQVPTAEDFMRWETQNGPVQVTALCHAAVITGVDDTYVYVNDPFGEKNRPVLKEDFINIYEQMGSQSLYLSEL